jgi:hypothetical protein
MRKVNDVIRVLCDSKITGIDEKSLENYLKQFYELDTELIRAIYYNKFQEVGIPFITFVGFIQEDSKDYTEKGVLEEILFTVKEILNILKNSDYANKTERGDSSHGKGVEGEDKQL